MPLPSCQVGGRSDPRRPASRWERATRMRCQRQTAGAREPVPVVLPLVQSVGAEWPLRPLLSGKRRGPVRPLAAGLQRLSGLLG